MINPTTDEKGNSTMSENYSTYIQIYLIMANGQLTSITERVNNQRDASKVEFPKNAIAYRFYDAKGLFSSSHRNFRNRGHSTAHNHSKVFGMDHQEFCDGPKDEAMQTLFKVKLAIFRQEGLIK